MDTCVLGFGSTRRNLSTDDIAGIQAIYGFRNAPPTANAGSDLTAVGGATVTLNGSASDPDGDPLTYFWTQTGGPAVTLNDPDSLGPWFVAPSAAGSTLVFQLAVSDGYTSTTDTVNVIILSSLPIANAGPDQFVESGVQVFLDGTGSYDPDGHEISTHWDLFSMSVTIPVGLDDSWSATSSFMAPVWRWSSITYVFELVVHKTVYNPLTHAFEVIYSSPDYVTIIVEEADPDGDGLFTIDERIKGTDPHDPDTDDDGMSDFDEIYGNGYCHRWYCYEVTTDPLDPDTDDDGLSDGQESVAFTNPISSDTDADGLGDGSEVNAYGTNPLSPDTDRDGLTDGSEVNTHGTNPTVADTDGDGLNDGAEVNTYGTNPLVADSDGDGLNDGPEVLTYNTNPLDPDSDDDSLTDGQEVLTYGSNPLDVNTDDDCLDDGVEVAMGLSPTLFQAPVIQLEPASLAFGEVNRRGRMIRYTLRNGGDLPLEIQNVSLTGTGFSMGETPATVSVGGGMARIPVVFSPPGLGEYEGSITFETNDCFHNPVSLAFSATGLISRMAASPSSIDFGEIPIWDRVFQTITLTNPDSNRPLKMTLSTDDPAFWPARLTANVDPGEVVEVPVYFRPYRYGNFQGRVWVKSFYGQDVREIEIPLQGFGAGDPPGIVVEPPSIDFGEIGVGGTVIREVLVRNNGEGRLYIHQVEVLGEGPEERMILPLLERFTVAPMSERLLRVRFRPEAGGTIHGNLRLIHNGSPGSGAVVIPFEGNGV